MDNSTIIKELSELNYFFHVNDFVNFENEDVDFSARISAFKRLSVNISLYDIDLKEMSFLNPKLSVRNELLILSDKCIKNNLIHAEFKHKKTITPPKVALLINCSTNFVEKYMDYIKLYMLLLSTNDYFHVRECLSMRKFLDVPKENLTYDENNRVLSGYIIKDFENSKIILNKLGLVSEVKTVSGKTGDFISSKVKINYKKHFSLSSKILMGFIPVILILYFLFMTPSNSAYINGDFPTKVMINVFNKTVKVLPSNKEASYITDSINLFGCSLEDSLFSILNYAVNNGKLVSGEEVLILIQNGEIYNAKFKKLDKFASDNGIKIKINNSGSESIILE